MVPGWLATAGTTVYFAGKVSGDLSSLVWRVLGFDSLYQLLPRIGDSKH